VDFAGQVGVVSGASSGLGRRIALELAAAGARVTTVARRSDLLAALGLPHHVCDVADAEAWTDVLRTLEAEHDRIDILVNAAGIEERRGADDVSLGDVETTMRVNFHATAAGTLAVLPGMLARRSGVICNVSSDHGRAPGPGTPAYCASKAAVSAFTESLAHEVADRGVRLHVLYPGWVPTALGQGAVDAGMKRPPRFVHRTEEQIAARTLRRLGSPRIDINASRLATVAPALRSLAPRLYAAGMRRAT
jgi:NAD(P)-dependent dehydrogenase (short-subunit alcohol dehydrogenase family)